MPKSPSFTSPRLELNTFGGETSRCTIPGLSPAEPCWRVFSRHPAGLYHFAVEDDGPEAGSDVAVVRAAAAGRSRRGAGRAVARGSRSARARAGVRLGRTAVARTAVARTHLPIVAI